MTSTPLLSPLEAEPLSSLATIRHGFFTRHGGISDGIYEALNCGRGSDDSPEAVAENRRRVAHHLGGADSDLVAEDVATPYQTHSSTVVVADAPFPLSALPKADAVVTRTKGLAVGVLTADCAPVLFADAEAGVVAAAHAGWRGAVGGVLSETIASMVKLGADTARIHAAVGPCINQAAYEVGPEFAAERLAESPKNAQFLSKPSPGAREHFDLPGYIMAALDDLALASTTAVTLCTWTNDSQFFSYRRAKAAGAPDYGRQISAILVT